jgi:hypothetical protein
MGISRFCNFNPISGEDIPTGRGLCDTWRSDAGFLPELGGASFGAVIWHTGESLFALEYLLICYFS